MRTSSVLIDASNLHVGGGVQVAASFIDELSRIRACGDYNKRFTWLANVEVHASREVVASLGSRVQRQDFVKAMDSSPKQLHRWVRIQSAPFDICFTVFGPRYGRSPGRRSVLGYADVTSVTPRPSGVPAPARLPAIKSAVRGAVSRYLLGIHDRVVVETEAMRAQVLRAANVAPSDVRVVPNAYNSIFDDSTRWGPPIRPEWFLGTRPDLVFGYITRLYPHKNFAFLGSFLDACSKLGRSATCLVTLRPDEWAKLDSKTQGRVTNVGPLSMSQVPRLYQECDAVLFPSLLEAFSVMPLEALKMGLPTFASDRDFVRTVCDDAVGYFDPLDPQTAAGLVCSELENPDALAQRGSRARELVAALPTARGRAMSYLNLIDELT